MELELAEPSVWDDPEKAQTLGRERFLELVVNTIETLDAGCDDASDLLDLAVEEDDEETADSVEQTLWASKPYSKSSNSAACSPERPMKTTPISIYRPDPVALKRKTGPRCCFACICDGARTRDLRPPGRSIRR